MVVRGCDRSRTRSFGQSTGPGTEVGGGGGRQTLRSGIVSTEALKHSLLRALIASQEEEGGEGGGGGRRGGGGGEEGREEGGGGRGEVRV